MDDLMRNEQWLREREAAESRRKATTEYQAAIGQTVATLASQVSAIYVFHPDAATAGRGFAKWAHIAMMAPLISAGVASLADVMRAASEADDA